MALTCTYLFVQNRKLMYVKFVGTWYMAIAFFEPPGNPFIPLIAGMVRRENVLNGIAVRMDPQILSPETNPDRFQFAINVTCCLGDYVSITSLVCSGSLSNSTLKLEPDRDWMLGKFAVASTHLSSANSHFFKVGKVVAYQTDHQTPPSNLLGKVPFEKSEFSSKLDKIPHFSQFPRFISNLGGEWKCYLHFELDGIWQVEEFELNTLNDSETAFVASGKECGLVANLVNENIVGISLHCNREKDIGTLVAVCELDATHTNFRGKFKATWGTGRSDENTFKYYRGKLVSGTIHVQKTVF
eukprot:Phypoly_transcript_13463.p1 GENE.Phypoly_transcript_13463~~Phypoly_transcript_13463.p1  ORF type:complete len:337 (+),score=38.18 Phypoly_transcript_13463:115-1011(+)